jgi:hypothetical protein
MGIEGLGRAYQYADWLDSLKNRVLEEVLEGGD